MIKVYKLGWKKLSVWHLLSSHGMAINKAAWGRVTLNSFLLYLCNGRPQAGTMAGICLGPQLVFTQSRAEAVLIRVNRK